MNNFSKIRVGVALAIGLLGSGIMWLVHPLNNYLLNNSGIAESYFPELAVILMLILILVINPVLMLFSKTLRLSVRQLALIFAMLFVAAAPLMTIKILPHTLARTNMNAIQDKTLNEIHKKMNLNPNLYLDPDLEAEEAPVSEQLYDELHDGNSIPWAAWFKPTMGWGFFIFSIWLVMAGLSLILFPQWRNNERLAFPVLTVMQTLIEKPDKGTRLPPIFRSNVFWITCLVVLILHSFNGLSHHTGGAFPKFPLSWDLSGTFSQGMWRHCQFKTGLLMISIIGFTYFMPSRVAFSLWFFFMASQFYRMIGYEYMAPFNANTTFDHRYGAYFGVGLVVLWLGRAQWLHVFKAMFSKAKDDETMRNRIAGWVFLVGNLCFVGWMLWAGVTLMWALAFLAILFFTSLILARLVAETGITFLANNFGPRAIYTLLPLKWMDAACIYVGGMFDFLITEGSSRVSAMVMLLMGLGVDKENKPRTQVRLLGVFLIILVLGFIICGMVHLYIGYNNPGSMDGLQTPLSPWGPARTGAFEGPLKAWARGSDMSKNYSQMAHMSFGLFLGAGLQVACLLSPAWPIHPAGLLMANSWYLNQIWASVFLGWMLKMLIVSYGGAQAYRKVRPLFIGMIVGEVFAAILWALVPVILISLGFPPEDVGHITIIPR